MMSLTLRQTAMLVMVFIVTSLGLIVLDGQHRLDSVRNPMSDALHPFTVAMSRVGNGIGSMFQGGDESLRSELESMTSERNALLAENARLKRLEQEVTELRRQLEFRQAYPDLDVVSASVVGHDPRGLQRILVIDRGANDGIRQGMAVMSPDFFVGQVAEVEQDRTRVTLATDASSQVGAKLQSNGAEGVVFGQGQAGGGLEMRYLDATTEVAEGDVVVTSGRTARVPEGLVIGRVYRIHRDVQADTLSLTIAPFVDSDTLGAVSVMLDDSLQDE